VPKLIIHEQEIDCCGSVLYEHFQKCTGDKGVRCLNCKHEKLDDPLPEQERIQTRAYLSSAHKEYEEF
jgi:hypothetical protein